METSVAAAVEAREVVIVAVDVVTEVMVAAALHNKAMAMRDRRADKATPDNRIMPSRPPPASTVAAAGAGADVVVAEAAGALEEHRLQPSRGEAYECLISRTYR